MSKEQKKFIITNFAYGNGPYLGITKLAIAFNDELEKRKQPRLGIIIPWVYGNRQKQIMKEVFSDHEKKFPEEILLDKELGVILKNIFFDKSTFEQYLKNWVKSFNGSSKKANQYLSGKLSLETLGGVKKSINGKNIVVELNRSPRLKYGVAPSYFTSFAYTEEIMEASTKDKRIKLPTSLLRSAAKIANSIEKEQRIHCIAYPGTFSWHKDYKPRYKTEFLVPPIRTLVGRKNKNVQKGIFTTVSGIPGLDEIYKPIIGFKLKNYTNNTDVIPEGILAQPNIISSKNILLHFARSGWGSVWLSILSKTPIIVPKAGEDSDPEIYFNNIAVKRLGVGTIYNNQSPDKLLKAGEKMRMASLKIKNKIMKKWKTIDGNKYAARLFVKDFLK